jgi:hypothetical protein
LDSHNKVLAHLIGVALDERNSDELLGSAFRINLAELQQILAAPAEVTEEEALRQSSDVLSGRVRQRGVTRKVAPHYSTLSQADMDMLTDMVNRAGYFPVVAALGDILTQDPRAGMELAPEMSLYLGRAAGYAEELDRKLPTRKG